MAPIGAWNDHGCRNGARFLTEQGQTIGQYEKISKKTLTDQSIHQAKLLFLSECLTPLREKSYNCPAVRSKVANTKALSNVGVLCLNRGVKPNHTEIPTPYRHLYLHLYTNIHKYAEIYYFFIRKTADRHILLFILRSSSFPLSGQLNRSTLCSSRSLGQRAVNDLLFIRVMMGWAMAFYTSATSEVVVVLWHQAEIL